MDLHVRKVILAAFVCLSWAGSSMAELQNVIVNGWYSVSAKDRVIGSVQAVEQASDTHILTEVAIPDLPHPKNYPETGRVFLSFYARLKELPDSASDATDVVVWIDDYQVTVVKVSDMDWSPAIVDFRPWAGKCVSLRVTSSSKNYDVFTVALARPRLVACHGPYYEGTGGLQPRSGPHGRPLINAGSSDQESFNAENGRIDAGMLALTRWDALEPSTVVLRYAGHERRIVLTQGMHWLPVPIDPPDLSYTLTVESGRIERGWR